MGANLVTSGHHKAKPTCGDYEVAHGCPMSQHSGNVLWARRQKDVNYSSLFGASSPYQTSPYDSRLRNPWYCRFITVRGGKYHNLQGAAVLVLVL